ncbi:MAG: 2-amino-5-formylamino-6-ribosylaminopyrimidin-4(3H)-one 5'-monophosphate deformylase [Candidatus Hadarchaeum sp.]|uniref:2-amino-5-formylamino-6-ribosylaminopyrimidin- 4(3H)-one 5'-monophosphate deformylase n=1 Tax=Candidatus Hadarchaeum sp. TaxID=2883567 RepID=UPI00316B76C3
MRLGGVGILALGSHQERHGAALPPDTDARLASHVAQEAAQRTGARFLGVLSSSYELPEINTGEHQTLDQVKDELRRALLYAKQELGIDRVVIVNGHGGNGILRNWIPMLEEELGMRLYFNNTIIDLEGPHAGTGELSMGAAIGIVDESKLSEHSDFSRYPEVAFIGMKGVREKYSWAEEQAREVEKLGLRIDRYLGEKLLECAIMDVINDVHEISREDG